MPALTAVNIKTAGNTAIVYAVLDGATDTFSVDANNHESLLLTNPTGGNITCTLTGADAPATKYCEGIGTVPVTPESITVNAGDSVSVYLSALREKLAGVVTVGTGTGLEAAIISY